MYPQTEEGFFEFLADFGDNRLRIIDRSYLWNGLMVSTVWLGTNLVLSYSGKPKIFETAVFDEITGNDRSLPIIRYATLEQAQIGHRRLTAHYKRFGTTVRYFWDLLLNNFFDAEL